MMMIKKIIMLVMAVLLALPAVCQKREMRGAKEDYNVGYGSAAGSASSVPEA